MTTKRVLTVDGEVIRVGTSLFKSDTGEVFWYQGVEDGSVCLEGVNQNAELDIDRFSTQLRDGDLVIESQPPGYTKQE